MEEDRMEAGMASRRPLLGDGGKAGDTDDNGDSHITASVVLSTSAAVCASFSFGCALGYSSSAEAGIIEELGLTVAAYSVFGSILTIGGAIGALFSGKIAACVGRKAAMWVSEIFCIIGWLAIAFAEDAWMLDIGRLSIGIGVGLISYAVPVYIAEIAPKNVRGACTFANQVLQNVGAALAYSLGNFISWRMLAIISAVPCFVQVGALFFVPESPRWLAKVGRTKEFQASLQTLRGSDADISNEAAEIREIMEEMDKDPRSRFLDLFQRKYWHSLTVGIGLMFLQQLSGSAGVSYYASTIFQRAGFPVSIGTTALALVLVPKAFLGLILVDKLGRRPLLLASGIGMCLSCLLLGTSFTLQGLHLLSELIPFLAFISILVYFTTFAIGLGALPWIIMSEIFPMNIKVSAGSLVTLANWSTSWIISYTFNFMLQWSAPGTFFIFAGVCGGSIAFTWFLVPETKGLTLEEIQASLSNFR